MIEEKTVEILEYKGRTFRITLTDLLNGETDLEVVEILK